jgi:molecular chaperone DnaJ
MTHAILGGAIEVPMLDGKKVKLTIPEGAQSGQQFRLRGKGMPVLRNRHFGDLYVQIAVEIPKKISRKQKDLLKKFDSEGKSGLYPESEKFLKSLDD